MIPNQNDTPRQQDVNDIDTAYERLLGLTGIYSIGDGQSMFSAINTNIPEKMHDLIQINVQNQIEWGLPHEFLHIPESGISIFLTRKQIESIYSVGDTQIPYFLAQSTIFVPAESGKLSANESTALLINYLRSKFNENTPNTKSSSYWVRIEGNEYISSVKGLDNSTSFMNLLLGNDVISSYLGKIGATASKAKFSNISVFKSVAYAALPEQLLIDPISLTNKNSFVLALRDLLINAEPYSVRFNVNGELVHRIHAIIKEIPLIWNPIMNSSETISPVFCQRLANIIELEQIPVAQVITGIEFTLSPIKISK